jgi:hypothetical protein
MLNARFAPCLALTRGSHESLCCALSRKHRGSQKPLYCRWFSMRRKISCVALCARAAQCFMCVTRSRQYATCGVVACANALHCAKTLVFLSRCSNSEGVFAIPAGTVRHRHSLMARRAAWRRSENHTRRRRKRAATRRRRARPSTAGRRSNHTLLPSLRLRTTSMTASNGPARVEER